MKTKFILLSVLLASGLVASASAAGRSSRNAGPAQRGSANPTCDLSGPGQGVPVRDGSGRARADRGNANKTGTPQRDGSGKTTAPGRGPKDGSGNNPDCPVVPQT